MFPHFHPEILKMTQGEISSRLWEPPGPATIGIELYKYTKYL